MGVAVGSMVLVGLGGTSVGEGVTAGVSSPSPQPVHSGSVATITSEVIAAGTKLSYQQPGALRRGSVLRPIPSLRDLRRSGVTSVMPSVPILTPLWTGLHRRYPLLVQAQDDALLQTEARYRETVYGGFCESDKCLPRGI